MRGVRRGFSLDDHDDRDCHNNCQHSFYFESVLGLASLFFVGVSNGIGKRERTERI